MAEIKVQRKSSGIIWVVLGLIALAVIIVVLWGWGATSLSMMPDRSTPFARADPDGTMNELTRSGPQRILHPGEGT